MILGKPVLKPTMSVSSGKKKKTKLHISFYFELIVALTASNPKKIMIKKLYVY
jgi:hypothetical protein